MENTFIALTDVVKFGGAVLVPIVGYGVRQIHTQIVELRKELKDYVTKEQCEAHRALLQTQIEGIRGHGKRR